VYHFAPGDFRETLHLSNLHDINFLTALQLGNSVGIVISTDIHIIAIEIIEDKVFNEEMTEIIKAKYQDIFDKVATMINRIVVST
jgi:hypothetical protein